LEPESGNAYAAIDKSGRGRKTENFRLRITRSIFARAGIGRGPPLE
jgi:hypothetical protein